MRLGDNIVAWRWIKNLHSFLECNWTQTRNHSSKQRLIALKVNLKIKHFFFFEKELRECGIHFRCKHFMLKISLRWERIVDNTFHDFLSIILACGSFSSCLRIKSSIFSSHGLPVLFWLERSLSLDMISFEFGEAWKQLRTFVPFSKNKHKHKHTYIKRINHVCFNIFHITYHHINFLIIII